MADPLFLSFDLSTQTLKALAIDNQFNIVVECAIYFDKDLPEFQTNGGIHKNGLEVSSPVFMWIKAVDLIFEKLTVSGLDFSRIRGISGAGQQHGSVYWVKNAEQVLRTLDSKRTLWSQLQECFSVHNCPIWMDSSTTKECRLLEAAAGGPEELAKITGSVAYERFTGNQIAKIHRTLPAAYSSCERISLVSSFLASLFIGQYAAIDLSDASGMNLLNINSKQWDEKLAQACSPNLIQRLGPPVPSKSRLGYVSKYMVDRYGFTPDCAVVAFTGDNPSSLAGMRLSEGDLAISLGTSDTLIVWLKKPMPATIGHIFINPIDDDAFMALLCYKNGSLTREHVRDMAGISSWHEFEIALSNTKPGNDGNIGIYFNEQEIVPFAKGIYRWNSKGERVDSFPSSVDIRALVEGQFLAKRIHAERLGFHLCKDSRILVTGGASKNYQILQVIADVFNIPVYVIVETVNSACLGGAYRAQHEASSISYSTFQDMIKAASPCTLAASPRFEIHQIYSSMLERYIQLEKWVASNFHL